jgi:hypothetical protein
LSLLDLYVLMLPVAGTILVIAVGRYDARQLRAETDRAYQAERKAAQQRGHTIL